MWHCFLTGSRKGVNGKQPLRVLHSIEYLTYDLKKKEIEVRGDFFVENISDEAASLRGLHRGNIDFELETDDWLKDEYWTPVLREIAGEYIGLKIKDENIFLCRAGADPLSVNLLKNPDKIKEAWSPPPTSNGAYMCFTGWESPKIPPKSCCLFRIAGIICGPTYEILMGEHGQNRIQIMGGKPLEEMILNDLHEQGNGTNVYDDFAEQYVDRPKFYHVFFEFADSRTVRIAKISEDLKKMSLNQPVNGRCISWCCSDMDFNIFAGANGPVLVLAANEEA